MVRNIYSREGETRAMERDYNPVKLPLKIDNRNAGVSKLKVAFTIILVLIALFIGFSCRNNTNPTEIFKPEVIEDVQEDTTKIFIIDRTGKKWDVTHAVEKYGFKPDEFQYGLGPDAIPPILDAQFFSPGEPGYPRDNDRFLMIGFDNMGDSRAYPVSVMKEFEVANDTYANNRFVAVGYWPLVGLAAVYSRKINGRKLTLSASGWTYHDTFVLYDFQTESLWYHLEGDSALTCISGFYADRRLKEFKSKFTRWSNWIDEHPNSKFLKKQRY